MGLCGKCALSLHKPANKGQCALLCFATVTNLHLLVVHAATKVMYPGHPTARPVHAGANQTPATLLHVVGCCACCTPSAPGARPMLNVR